MFDALVDVFQAQFSRLFSGEQSPLDTEVVPPERHAGVAGRPRIIRSVFGELVDVAVDGKDSDDHEQQRFHFDNPERAPLSSVNVWRIAKEVYFMGWWVGDGWAMGPHYASMR